MDNLTGTEVTRTLGADVYYFDLGRMGAFLNIEDIMRFYATRDKWPAFTKALDPKEIGALRSCSNYVSPDRLRAAKAYAAMSDVGETTAAAAAGRWLGLKGGTSSLVSERKIRGLLRGVSDGDAISEVKAHCPPFMRVKPKSDNLTPEEVDEWKGGRTAENEAIFDKLVSVIMHAKGDWVLCGSGGRAFGLKDGRGDYDFLVASKNPKDDISAAVSALKNLSLSGEGTLTAVRWGHLLTMDDVEAEGGLKNVDITFPKEGYEGVRALAHKTLFWTRLLSNCEYNEGRVFFEVLKTKARHSGTLGSSRGGLNMWSFMLKGLEHLIRSGIIITNPMCPLIDQDVIINTFSDDPEDDVRACLLEFSDDLRDGNRVMGDYSMDQGNSDRSKSEFNNSPHIRVMRDPFSYLGDNVLRSLHSRNVDVTCNLLRHIAYCHGHAHNPNDFEELEGCRDRNNARNVYPIPVRIAGDDEGQTVHVRSGMHLAFIPEAGVFGIGLSETEARSRAILNDNQDLSDVTLILGPALTQECEGMLSEDWVLANKNHLFCLQGMDNGFTIEFGTCPNDTFGSDTLTQCDWSEIEMLLACLWLQGKMNKKAKVKTLKESHLRIKNIGVRVYP